MAATYYISKKHGPVVRLYARDKERRRQIVDVYDFKPYFYAPFGEVENAQDMVLDVFGRPVTKVFAPTPGDVPHLRRMYSFTDEADVPFEYRYLIDNKIYDAFTKNKDGKLIPCESLHIPPRVGYADIEVISPVEINPRPHKPDYPVISFQVKDSYTGKRIVILQKNEHAVPLGESKFLHRGEKVYICDSLEQCKEQFQNYNNFVIYMSNEKELLITSIRVIEWLEFDIVGGWFWNQYDMPYLYYRMMRAGIYSPFSVNRNGSRWTVKTRSFESVDYLEWYRVFTKPEGEKRSFDLKLVVAEEASFKYRDIGDAIIIHFNQSHEALIHYCLDDCEAVYQVDEARHLTRYFDTLRRKNGCAISVAHIRSAVMKTLLLRESQRPIPTRKKLQLTDRRVSKYEGALVDEPKVGLHENVVVLDIKSLYPVGMLSLNISPETKSEHGTLVAPNGVRFLRTPKGLLGRIIEKLMAEKDRLDKYLRTIDPASPEYDLILTERETTKYALNSTYGIQAWEPFELYDKDCAAATTSIGRYIKTVLRRKFEELGYVVVAGDTDSIHIKVSSKKEASKVQEIAQKILDEIVQEQKWLRRIEIEQDVFYDRVLYVTKKRYVGWASRIKGKETGKLVTKGLAAKRSDSAIATVELQKKFFESVIKQGDIQEGMNLIRQAVKEFEFIWKHADCPYNNCNKQCSSCHHYKEMKERCSLSRWSIPKGLSKEIYKNKFAWAEARDYSIKHLKLRFREDRKPRLVYGTIIGKPVTKYFCIRDEEDDYFGEQTILNVEKMLNVVIWKKFEKVIQALGYERADITTGTRKTELTQWLT